MENTMWKLFLDDLRNAPDDSFIVARSVEEAQRLIEENGMPECISFDHDLGMDVEENILPDGYDFAKWIVNQVIEEKLHVPSHFSYTIHSMNPVGAENIRQLMNNFFKCRTNNVQKNH
jgi:hypothetical protein